MLDDEGYARCYSVDKDDCVNDNFIEKVLFKEGRDRVSNNKYSTDILQRDSVP